MVILKETLTKSRFAVSDASNEWRYDNSKDDYFQKDTIVLNTARTYKMEYCNGVNWSFYKMTQFVLEFPFFCNEPPTKKISKREDFIRLKYFKHQEKYYLKLFNINGLFDTFEIIDLQRNKLLGTGKDQFDYTLFLLRIK